MSRDSVDGSVSFQVLSCPYTKGVWSRSSEDAPQRLTGRKTYHVRGPKLQEKPRLVAPVRGVSISWFCFEWIAKGDDGDPRRKRAESELKIRLTQACGFASRRDYCNWPPLAHFQNIYLKPCKYSISHCAERTCKGGLVASAALKESHENSTREPIHEARFKALP